MAVASIDTNTLLNAWQRRMSVSPWHFNQVTGAGIYAPLTNNGNGIYVQPERELIAEGIAVATSLIIPHLQFYHRPTYVSELIPIARLGRWIPHRPFLTEWKWVDAIGSRGTTLIEADATIVYSDVDGDGVDDTATVTVATAFTDPTQIQIFFRVADGADGDADVRWQIEPAKVVISGGNATITAHRALFVRPDTIWALPYNSPNYNDASKRYADTQTPADFVTEVDVYRVYPDTTNAVRFLYNPYTYCNPTATAMGTIEGTALIENGQHGSIYVNQVSADCWHRATYIQINYRAGYPLDATTGLPDRALETAFLRLANAENPQEPANFNDAPLMIWQRDAYLYPQGELAPNLVNNPFGVKRGQVEAWRTVLRYASVRSGLI